MQQKSQFSVIPFSFDTRMVEWNMKHNLITKDQLEKFLKTLPDDANNGETVQVVQIAGVSTEGQNL